MPFSPTIPQWNSSILSTRYVANMAGLDRHKVQQIHKLMLILHGKFDIQNLCKVDRYNHKKGILV
jgi:hypothetical protein